MKFILTTESGELRRSELRRPIKRRSDFTRGCSNRTDNSEKRAESLQPLLLNLPSGQIARVSHKACSLFLTPPIYTWTVSAWTLFHLFAAFYHSRCNFISPAAKMSIRKNRKFTIHFRCIDVCTRS